MHRLVRITLEYEVRVPGAPANYESPPLRFTYPVGDENDPRVAQVLAYCRDMSEQGGSVASVGVPPTTG